MNSLYQKIIPKISKKEQVAALISDLEAKEQIGLGLNVRPENQIKKIRKKTRNWMEILHINPYWKNFSAVSMLITSLSASLIYLFLYLTNYLKLPQIIPTVYNQSTKSWNYSNKDDLLIVPILHFVFTLILIRLNIAIFKFDRRLVLIINSSMVLFNILFLYEIFQIYTMLSVY